MNDRAPEKIFLSVVIPAYNKEASLASTLQAVVACLSDKPFTAEVIVVDDGSVDRTAEVARETLAGRVRSQVVRREQNLGKGASVREGILLASGQVILFSDDDLSTPIDELDKLVAAIRTGADVAIGSRALPGSNIRVRQRRPRELMGKIFNLLVRLFVLKGYRDTQCGFKAFRSEVAMDLFTRLRTAGFAFDVEILVLCRERGYRVAEVPVAWSDARPSRVRLIRGSLGMLREILRIRRLHRRRSA